MNEKKIGYKSLSKAMFQLKISCNVGLGLSELLKMILYDAVSVDWTRDVQIFNFIIYNKYTI